MIYTFDKNFDDAWEQLNIIVEGAVTAENNKIKNYTGKYSNKTETSQITLYDCLTEKSKQIIDPNLSISHKPESRQSISFICQNCGIEFISTIRIITRRADVQCKIPISQACVCSTCFKQLDHYIQRNLKIGDSRHASTTNSLKKIDFNLFKLLDKKIRPQLNKAISKDIAASEEMLQSILSKSDQEYQAWLDNIAADNQQYIFHWHYCDKCIAEGRYTSKDTFQDSIAAVVHRTYQCKGCLVGVNRSISKYEYKLYDFCNKLFTKDNGYIIKAQYKLLDYPKSPVDIAIFKKGSPYLAIEYDGGYWHCGRPFKDDSTEVKNEKRIGASKLDSIKTTACLSHGFKKVIRLRENCPDLPIQNNLIVITLSSKKVSDVMLYNALLQALRQLDLDQLEDKPI